MQKNFEILDWDSQFFGSKIARINSNISQKHYQQAILELYGEAVDLVYFNSAFELKETAYYSVLKIDEMVELSKELKFKKKFHPKIKFFDQPNATPGMKEQVKRIARQSRFYFDNNIEKSKVYELYDIWLDKSVNKKGADAVLVYEDNAEVKGFATIKRIENGTGIIPLMGVEAKSEGKGISFMLMEAIETYLLENNCKILKSTTQAKNIKALKVYERFGIQCKSSYAINHLWRKPNNLIG
ncbi:Acetyltransferase (GNAT) family protein [Salegentibacter holothuriorum]|uniref:Acetyltransferase (GNAT) family protein n=1 Tax=Salegentibacter holothuriorum TaxID=241145 RepID=A0A1T5AQE8_9FLAO|nr:GNAT family N-acetyltransferase [Salegentibacter holothuriorum]SKB37099.1 Acetyltransferase (GNAT) family protein [Salegentibacter holothuriorum]